MAQAMGREEVTAAATRCAIVVDATLPPGLAANAAAVLALTLGATSPALIGQDLVDADGNRHPGLIDRGLPILHAPAEHLVVLRARALSAGVGVIDLPTFGQMTTDYTDFRARVGRTPNAELTYLALLLHGPARAVRRLTGSLPLLR
jgi:hypothetical protein